ncbi:MAG: sporulation protein YabP [Bacillota bacterium]|nr:sporulation protein YabP [Bacillota bacterium]
MIEERKTTQTKSNIVHNIIMEDRKKVSVCGVEEVDSFDESSIILKTTMGTLYIKGSGMHINKLSLETGEVTVDGLVDSCLYSDTEKPSASGFFNKLFK